MRKSIRTETAHAIVRLMRKLGFHDKAWYLGKANLKRVHG